MNKIEELKKMLDDVGIECEIKGFNLKKELHLKDKIVAVYYVVNDELLIPRPPLTEYEKIVKRYKRFTINELFKRIKYCVENNTDTYVEEETFEAGENVLVPNTTINDIFEIKLTEEDLEYIKRKCYFVSHSKRKCLEYLYVALHKRKLKEQEIKKDLLKQMEELND